MRSPVNVRGTVDSMEVLLQEDSDSTLEINRTASRATIVPSMVLSWHDITVTEMNSGKSSKIFSCCTENEDVEKKRGNHKRRILDEAFGVAQPGEVVAILGPSGSGKTTLLNVITKRNTGQLDVQGSVKVNGLRATRDYMKKVCAYVQQDDLFVGSLTVEEHLRFMAKLRMGHKYSTKDKENRVQDVMNDLGLKDSAKSLIGTRTRRGISGGEKKRLAFASEILTSPPILFCDEPTSGLDAFLAFQVITVLKRLAEKKRMTILLTIHQPSSQVFELFDRIYLLAEGRVAFCGTQAEAQEMWTKLKLPPPKNFNPSDHYLTTLSAKHLKQEYSDRQRVKAICDFYRDSELGQDTRRESRGHQFINEDSSSSSSEDWRRRQDISEKKFHASFPVQVSTLLWRNMMTVLREPTLLKVQLMQSIIVALLTGLVYLNNNVEQRKVMNINGAMYTMVTNMAFMFQYSTVHHFCFEINTFYRETQGALYRVSAYFIAKNIAELPSYVLSAVVFTTILYWMSGLYASWESFLIYVLVGVLIQNIAVSIGYMFSCVFGSLQVAVAFLSIFVIPMMAFGGFFINQASLPAYFIPFKYVSYFGYGFEALVVNEWSHIDEIPGCTKPGTHGCYGSGSDVIRMLSFKERNLWPDIGVMAGMILIFRFIAFSALYIRVKVRR